MFDNQTNEYGNLSVMYGNNLIHYLKIRFEKNNLFIL